MPGFDRLIEDHRRDPDPHPRLKKAIDESIAALTARVDRLDPDVEGSAGVVVGDAIPTPTAYNAVGAPGTSEAAARQDHRHELILPEDQVITGDGLVYRDAVNGTAEGTQNPTVSGTMSAGTLHADDQQGTGERVVLASAIGDQRAEAKLAWSSGSAVTAPWVGVWDFENVALPNLTGGTGGAFTNAAPGYGGYALAAMDTTTPIRGTTSIKVRHGYPLEARYATWTAVAFATITFGAWMSDGSELYVAPSPTDITAGGLSAAFIVVKSDTTGLVRLGTTSASILAVAALSSGPVHVAVVANNVTKVVDVYINGSLHQSVTCGAGTLATTHGGIGTFSPSVSTIYGSTRLDEVFLVNGALNAEQIESLASGTVWSSVPDGNDGNGVLTLGPNAAVKVLNHAGTGQRMQTAMPDGTLTPVSQVVWTGIWLEISGADVAAVSANGIVARTADNTFASRSVDVTVGHLTVTDGDGVAGNPTLGLPNVGTPGAFGSATKAVTVTTDAQGRVSSISENTIASGTGPFPSSFGFPLPHTPTPRRPDVAAFSLGV
jgi:hypothetical protein